MEHNKLGLLWPHRLQLSVVVIVAFLSTRMKRVRRDTEPIVYGPRLVDDEHRHKKFQLIYNSTDKECLAMPR
jgi:hypothetical protein